MNEQDPKSKSNETESRDSVLVEFTDADLTLVQTNPDFVDAVRRANLVPSLRSAPGSDVELAECLLEQALLFKLLKRYSEAAPRIAEAAKLFERAGLVRRVADCFRVAADVHRGLGDVESALDFLRKEEDIRRHLAA